MASLVPSAKTEPTTALRCIEFSMNGGRRQRLKIGRVSGRLGEDFLHRIERLIEEVSLGQSHSDSMCGWLQSLDPRIQNRLVEVGLLKQARQNDVMLGDFLDTIKAKTTVKTSTSITYGNPIRNLVDHFGRNRPMRSISHADAVTFVEDFLRSPTASYEARRLAKATVNRRVVMCRQFFTAAKKKGLIAENPFEGIKAGSQRNKKRLVFVEQAWVDQMVAATADLDWKLLLVLARYGGLRLPSEVVQLQWKHINLDPADGSILVHSPKTEHHEGGDTRHVPLFDELRDVLVMAMSTGVNPDDFVIQNPNYRRPKANLRTQFMRIAKQAGVEPWGKAFQNMRATRETELIKLLGVTTACEVIGNSPEVAYQHYDMIQPDFVKSAVEACREAKQGWQNRGCSPQESAGSDRKASDSSLAAANIKSAGFRTYPQDASKVLPLQDLGMGDGGCEHSSHFQTLRAR